MRFYKRWIILSLLCLFIGCTSQASIDRIETLNQYETKLPLTAFITVPAEIGERVIKTRPISDGDCITFEAKVDAGKGFVTAVTSAFTAVFEHVTIAKQAPPESELMDKGYDVVVHTELLNEDAAVTVTDGIIFSNISTQYKVALKFAFYNMQGNAVFSFTAHGNGFKNKREGICPDIGPVLRSSVMQALEMIADEISQATYGSAQIHEL
jgi:hypothetical protein